MEIEFGLDSIGKICATVIGVAGMTCMTILARTAMKEGAASSKRTMDHLNKAQETIKNISAE